MCMMIIDLCNGVGRANKGRGMFLRTLIYRIFIKCLNSPTVLKFFIVDFHNTISISVTARLHQEQHEAYTKLCI